MNRGSIRSYASLFTGDPNATRFTETQYNNAINLAQEQFALDTKALYKDASTFTVVDGTATYDLPSDFMFERAVTHKGLRLQPISRATLEYYMDSDWSEDDGTPKYYMIDPEQARRVLRLYPSPTASDTGANLILTYYPLPAELTSDSDTPLNSSSLLAQFHVGLAAYAAWILLGYDVQTPEIAMKRSDLIRQYQDKVTEAIDTFGNTKSEGFRMKGGRRYRS